MFLFFSFFFVCACQKGFVVPGVTVKTLETGDKNPNMSQWHAKLTKDWWERCWTFIVCKCILMWWACGSFSPMIEMMPEVSLRAVTRNFCYGWTHWCYRWPEWKAKGGTINFCEMLRVNLGTALHRETSGGTSSGTTPRLFMQRCNLWLKIQT